ncbi:MAG: restriction endonuclease subunit S [Bacteroidetes bacterium]|nr:MAG: restriction endonuclease subunit S [Bacteroidota bacterium]
MMEKWKEVEIDAVCNEIVDCLNRTAPKVDYETPYKMIRTSNVRHGRIDLENVFYVDEATYKKWTRRLIPKKYDIILTREAPLGEIGMLKSDDLVFLGQRTVMYRANEKVCDPHFLYYSLLGPNCQSNIKAFGSGSTVEHMKVPDSKRIKLYLPSLRTQRKIASILSAYDDLIENNLRRIKLLEEMAQLTYEEWFVRMKFPGHENAKVDEETGLPEGWRKVKTSDLFDITIGKTPPRGESLWFNQQDGVKWASIKDIRGANIYIFESSETISNEAAEKFNFKFIEEGNVVLSFKLTVGLVAIANERMTTNEAIAHFNPKSSNYLKTSYSYFYLRRFNYNSLGSTSSIGNAINSKIVKRIPFVIPSKNVASSFDIVINPLMKTIKKLLIQNQLLKEARDILLPRLMTGVIDVEELE